MHTERFFNGDKRLLQEIKRDQTSTTKTPIRNNIILVTNGWHPVAIELSPMRCVIDVLIPLGGALGSLIGYRTPLVDAIMLMPIL